MEKQLRKYPSGAVRDSNEGKIRWDLVPKECLERVAIHYTNGAKKYEDPNNWKKGIPDESYKESAERHLMQYLLGKRDEDHLAAIVFNVFGLMWNEIQRENSIKEPAYIRLRNNCESKA